MNQRFVLHRFACSLMKVKFIVSVMKELKKAKTAEQLAKERALLNKIRLCKHDQPVSIMQAT